MKSYALLALALVASMGKLPGRKGSLRRREYVQPRQSRPHLDLKAVTLGVDPTLSKSTKSIGRNRWSTNTFMFLERPRAAHRDCQVFSLPLAY